MEVKEKQIVKNNYNGVRNSAHITLVLVLDQDELTVRKKDIYLLGKQDHPEDAKLPKDERRKATLVIVEAPRGNDPQNNPPQYMRLLVENSVDQIKGKL